MGDDLQSCRDALASGGDTSLHLLERINVDLQVQNSIIPSAVNLARIKVSGNLPTLQLNFSDIKYKSILRLIDVTIPKFGDETPNTIPSTATGAYRLPRLFVGPDKEYNIEDDGDEESSRDEFLEAEDSGGEVGLCRRVRYCGPLNYTSTISRYLEFISDHSSLISRSTPYVLRYQSRKQNEGRSLWVLSPLIALRYHLLWRNTTWSWMSD